MNKIVIVGHPLSGYQEVQNLLNACGMSVAQPSRREGFMPDQISTTLCKVHNVPELSQLESAEAIQQIEPGPVWHGMALDLMLGNLEQPLWGWADPKTIYLLNYWRDLDPSITFILVYDRPHSVLTQAGADEALGLSAESLAARTRNWAAYNSAMLHFFLRNPQRCLLVHSQQVRESASSYLQQVRARINAPWSVRLQELAAPEALQNSANAPAESVCHPSCQPPQDALALFLAEALLQQQPASLQLYQELQAVANLPSAGGADVVINDRSALDAWLVMAAKDQSLVHTDTLVQQKQQLVERLSMAQAQAEQLAQERQRLIDEQARLHHSQTEASQRHLAELQGEQQALQQAQHISQQENKLLLTQLHQVQEELERHHLEGQQQKAAIKALQETEKLAAARAKDITQLNQEKATLIAEKDTLAKLAAERAVQNEQLEKQLATQTQQAAEKAAQLSQQAEQLKKQQAENAQLARTHAELVSSSQAQKLADQQESELLLTQLHQVQEELERYYLEGQQQKAAIKALQETEKLATARAKELTQLSQVNAKLTSEKDHQAKLAAERTAQNEKLKKQLTTQTQLATDKTAQLSQQADQLKKQMAENEQLARTHAELVSSSQVQKLVDQQEKAKLIAEKDHQAKLAAERAAQNEQLKKQLVEKEQLAKGLQQKTEQLQAHLTAAQAKAAEPVVDSALKKENELLLAQVHLGLEELDRYYVQEQAQSRELSKLSQAAEHASALQQELDKLQAELQVVKVTHTAPALGSINQQLLTQLFKVQEEQERRFHGVALAPPALADLNAADRVRQHLSYRLGSTMIDRSRSFAGWMTMPLALIKTARQYRRDLAAKSGQPKPSPVNPQDKQLAEAVKQHLSYKLGATLISHSRTPVGWVKMPFALRREVKEFKKRKRG